MSTFFKITLSSTIAITVALLLFYFSPVQGSYHRPLEALIYQACPLVAFVVGYLLYQVSGLLGKEE
ncbi:hypothetical protein [uncultured Shewanella sp.]|uniref:hypothetical protein n=1 Tax=uncultured Shewanella sp. TaxID=173975 RepID=UPI00261EDE01|nr:hypothetical protein [uncultured Shewanella sp.]